MANYMASRIVPTYIDWPAMNRGLQTPSTRYYCLIDMPSCMIVNCTEMTTDRDRNESYRLFLVSS